MVAKISIGSSLYGALAYNSEKINREEGRLLGANKIILPADGQIDIGRIAENFNAFMPKTGKTKKPVLHISLNPHPDDKLTDQDFEILAREYMEKLGFGEQPFIIYKHEDIYRHHIHIVTVNVNEQGKRLNQDFLFRRSKRITTELEEKYNLHKAQREKITPDMTIKKVDLSGDIKRQVANTVKMVGMRYKRPSASIMRYFPYIIYGVSRPTAESTDASITVWCILPQTMKARLSPIRSRLRASANSQAGRRLTAVSRKLKIKLMLPPPNVRLPIASPNQWARTILLPS